MRSDASEAVYWAVDGAVNRDLLQISGGLRRRFLTSPPK